jgi:large subunit ribosomal protein L4e
MAKIKDLQGVEKEDVKLPDIFSTKYNLKLVKKVVLASQSNKRQPYGTDPIAGLRSSAHYHASRHYRYTMMNREMARISRIHGRVGYLAHTARVVPQSRKGRRGQPPKAEKDWSKKINKKESKAAIKSLIGATASAELVKKRGHKYEKELPVVVVDDIENIKKTKDMKVALSKILGVKELERSGKKTVRAGKGTMRGRKYKKKVGPLLVFAKKCDALRCKVPGVDTVTASNLNAELLAPGTQGGRLTVYSVSALKALEKRFG